MSGLIVDLFAGGGGASLGIELALGRDVDIAINHDATALAVHRANHPRTKHLEADIWEVKPLEATRGRPVELLWASPDCKHFSCAKGDVPKSKGIRSLAWAVTRWAKAVRPRVICVENVPEFQGWTVLGRDGRPDKARKGETFRAWVRRLERLGYDVDWKVLDSSLFGAPTKRRRIFVIARCDGLPIVWPKATHGLGGLPLHTAAECIDWSMACPSIFERKKPLAAKTLWRIAEGIRRYVLDSPRPFLVEMNHANKPRDVGAPLGVVTTQGNRHNLVTPVVAKLRHDSIGSSPDEPMPTITAGSGRAERPAGAGHALGIVAPHIVQVNHGGDEARGSSIEDPLSTVTATQRGHAVVTPVLAGVGGRAGQSAPTGGNEPVGTITAKNDRGLLAATLIQTGYGEREGQAARVPHLDKPLGTCVDGQKHALVSGFLAKYFGGEVGHAFGEQVPTITATDHNALAAASLVKLRGTCVGQAVDELAPTLSAQGTHVAEVRAFLTTYYGDDKGTGGSLFEPTRTLTTRHRLGLVTVEGIDYQIVDIGLRMLDPHELLRAQFGEHAASYDMSAARTKSAKVRLVGNSVVPHVARAIVAANVCEQLAEAAV